MKIIGKRTYQGSLGGYRFEARAKAKEQHAQHRMVIPTRGVQLSHSPAVIEKVTPTIGLLCAYPERTKGPCTPLKCTRPFYDVILFMSSTLSVLLGVPEGHRGRTMESFR